MNYSVNLSSGQTVEVVIGEAAQINVEQALNYIESGRVEITKYVNEWAKPEITNYTKEYAEPIVTEIVNQKTKPLIDDYLNTTTKPQIDEYVADNVKPYSDSAQDSAAKAKISKDNAQTSETNAKASELAAASSAGVASSAAVTATEAKLWAVGTIAEKPEGSSKYWAEQAKQIAQVYNASETVKGIVRLATSNEVTAGTNDSAAITPLKLKQKIAQDLTNPSANTVPSTKAVKDESSRITTLMDTELAKKLNVNARTRGEFTDLRTSRLNEGNTSTVYVDGYMINSNDGINGCLVAPELNANGTICNRFMARKKINGNNVYRGMTIGVKTDGSTYTELDYCQNNNSIVTTVSHGSNYVRFGNGLQICWGSGTGVQTFPQPFKDTNYMIADSDLTYHKYEGMWTSDKTPTQFKINNSGNAQWIAIGYWY